MYVNTFIYIVCCYLFYNESFCIDAFVETWTNVWCVMCVCVYYWCNLYASIVYTFISDIWSSKTEKIGLTYRLLKYYIL